MTLRTFAWSVSFPFVFFASNLHGAVPMQIVVLTGQVAPGTDAGVVFSDFGVPLIDDAGLTAFNAKLTGPGVVTDVNDGGIWVERAGSLTLVARTRSQAPGTPAGVNFSVLSYLMLNGAGRTAFDADLAGTGVDLANNAGIWSDAGGALAIVTRAGRSAPGNAAGLVEWVWQR